MFRVMDLEEIRCFKVCKTQRGAKIVCNRLNYLWKLIGNKEDRFSIIYDDMLG